MKITALDIRQKTFEKAFRGLDADEVQAFLLTVSQQWERMGDENRDLRNKLDFATQEVQKMREIETSLYRTLKTAEDTGNSITEQAQRDAELRVREAQLQAEELLSQARQKARALVDEAYQQAEKSVAEMQAEVNALGQEHQRLEGLLETLVRDLQHLATDALDKVEKTRNRPKSSTAAILSRAASVKVNKPTYSPEPPATMYPGTPTASSAAALPGAVPATSFSGGTAAPEAYNPKPGQQPDPEISPKPLPNENPGQVPPSRIDEPAPSRIIEPDAPNVEPVRPDIQPVGPSQPEIMPPSPAPQPGPTGPGFVAEPVGTEKSFFDEI